MKFRTLMIIKAIVCLVLGVPILLATKFFYGLFGMELGVAGVFAAREYGASLLGNFLLTYFGRFAQDTKARRALIMGMTLYNAIGFIITLITVLSGQMNFLGWGPVAIYLFFGLGFGYFLIKPPKP